SWCGRLFQTMDEISEVDHIQPLAQQGADEPANRQLLHGHCHDAKTARDGSNQSRSSEVPMTRAKKKAAQRQVTPRTQSPRSTVEEPDEPKWLTSGVRREARHHIPGATRRHAKEEFGRPAYPRSKD